MTIVMRTTKQINPIGAYYKELRKAKTVRDKKIAAAHLAYSTATQKAWEKYQAAMEL